MSDRIKIFFELIPSASFGSIAIEEIFRQSDLKIEMYLGIIIFNFSGVATASRLGIKRDSPCQCFFRRAVLALDTARDCAGAISNDRQKLEWSKLADKIWYGNGHRCERVTTLGMFGQALQRAISKRHITIQNYHGLSGGREWVQPHEPHGLSLTALPAQRARSFRYSCTKVCF